LNSQNENRAIFSYANTFSENEIFIRKKPPDKTGGSNSIQIFEQII